MIVETIQDSFDYRAYDNNKGTVNWTTAWTEIGEADGPLLGLVQIIDRSYNEQQCASGDCLRLGGQQAGRYGAVRAVDLSEASSAFLNFNWRRDQYQGYGANRPAKVQVSADGGENWDTLQLIEPGQFDYEQQNAWFDISAYASADTKIRFITGKTEWISGFIYFDNILIEYTEDDIPATRVTELVEANTLHNMGVVGTGVTVAVVDTGTWSHPGLTRATDGRPRILAQYDAITDQLVGDENNPVDTDSNGHGTHVTSMILNSQRSTTGEYNGAAAGANFVSVRAFDRDGAGSYMDVIRGIDWVIANKNSYNIRILNLSFSAPPQSYYWEDPLNQGCDEGVAGWHCGCHCSWQ